MARKRQQSSNGQEGSSPLEWIAASLGAVLVFGMLGLMVYEAVMESPAPPRIDIRVDGIEEVGGRYVVTITAHNRGPTTAADVAVEGTLRAVSGETEKSSVTIEYVPPQAEVKAGLFFSTDPRSGELDVRARGFREP